MKLTSIFTQPKILQSKAVNIPQNQINSFQVKQLINQLLKHLDKLNLAAITPQNIFPQKNQTLEQHLLNILIFRDQKGNPNIIYNPQITNSSGQQINYERCGSIELDEELTFDAYTKRPKNITLIGYNFQQDYSDEQAAYILHELDHLNGITISDKNKTLDTQKLQQIDSEISPSLIIIQNGLYKIIKRTNKNKNTPNSISFDYIEEFHKGIEKELNNKYRL